MQISPRYEGPPILAVESFDGDPGAPMLRQRRRLGTLLAALDDQQWAAPSRCDGWSVRDVVLHLNGTNRFWAHSIARGQAGAPTRFLDGFDPVASPAQMVAGAAATPAAEVLAEYLASVDALADVVDGLDGDAWELVAEAPPGHVSTRGVVLHALWDAWIHERDIVVPLGLSQPVEHDELTGSLLYAAVLGPAFLASSGSERAGTMVVRTDQVTVVVELGGTVRARTRTEGFAPGDDALVLEGDPVDLTEALSCRLPHEPPIPAEHAWMLTALAEVFDQA